MTRRSNKDVQQLVDVILERVNEGEGIVKIDSIQKATDFLNSEMKYLGVPTHVPGNASKWTDVRYSHTYSEYDSQ